MHGAAGVIFLLKLKELRADLKYSCKRLSLEHTICDEKLIFGGREFQMTVNAITKDADKVQLQAIEFWSTICDEEFDLLEDGNPCENYIAGAVQHLVPLLFTGNSM